jgi:hypothetical protein
MGVTWGSLTSASPLLPTLNKTAAGSQTPPEPQLESGTSPEPVSNVDSDPIQDSACQQGPWGPLAPSLLGSYGLEGRAGDQKVDAASSGQWREEDPTD